MATYLELATQFVELDEEEKAAKLKLDGLKKKREELKKAILEQMQNGQSTKIEVMGKLVHLRREVWASIDMGGIDESLLEMHKARAIKELEDFTRDEGGDSHLVYKTVNSRTLSKFAREELVTDNDGMPVWPPELSPFFKCAEKFDVRIRKA